MNGNNNSFLNKEIINYGFSKDKYLYILILNYNCWQHTIECLESVLKSSYLNYKVIVIDNNSSDNSIEYIKKWVEGKLDCWVSPEHPLRHLSIPPESKPISYQFISYPNIKPLDDSKKITLIQTGENRGFAAGNNKALELLLNGKKEGFVFLLNPDVMLEKNTLLNLVQCVLDKNVVYGLNVFNYQNPNQLLFKGGASLTPYGTIRFVKETKDIEKLDYISGGAFFTHLDNFRKIGLLPEEYFLYWEETDWCTKARKLGIKLEVCEKARCFDKGGVSIGRGSFLSEYYYTLNSLKYHKKYFPSKVKQIKLFSLARIIKRIIKGKFALVKAIIKALKDFESEK